MAPIIPTCAPTALVAGDSAIWTRTWSDYPLADGWVATYALRGASVLDVVGTTAVDGTSFLFTASAATTGPLLAGQYQWRHWVALGGEIHTTEYGVLTVAQNPYTAEAGDLVSSTEKELALVEAQIATLQADPNESYAIGQRSATKRSLSELMTLRGVLVAKLGRERGQALPGYAMRFRGAR